MNIRLKYLHQPRRHLQLILLILFALHYRVDAQIEIDTFSVPITQAFAERIPSHLYLQQDSAGNYFSHFARIAQYNQNNAVDVTIGNLLVVTDENDTIRLHWDHPLYRNDITPGLSLYEYNSTTYQNELISQTFQVKPADTLIFSMHTDIEWPVEKDSAGNSVYVVDTNLFSVADTLAVITTLVQDGGGAVLDTLDLTVILPTTSPVLYHVNTAFSQAQKGFQYGYFCRKVADTSWCGADVRIRVDVIHYPQLRGDYSGRRLLAQFYWGECHADYIRDIYYNYYDSLSMAKRSISAPDVRPSYKLHVFPTILHQRKPLLYVALEGEYIGPAHFEVVNASGEIVYSTTIALSSHTGTANLPISLPQLYSGSYLLRLILDGHKTTVKIFVIK